MKKNLGVVLPDDMNADQLQELQLAVNKRLNDLAGSKAKNFKKTEEFEALKAKRKELIAELRKVWGLQNLKFEIDLFADITDERLSDSYYYLDDTINPNVDGTLSPTGLPAKEHKILSNYIEDAIDDACEDILMILNKDKTTTRKLNAEIYKINKKFKEHNIEYKDIK